MKRFLSIILCAALIVGMIPAVFAAEGDTSTTETLEYVFLGSAYGVETTTTSGAVSMNNAAYFDEGGNNLINKTISPNVWYYSGSYHNHTYSYRTNKQTIPYITHSKNGNDNVYSNLGNNGLCLAIEVNNPGIYRPAADFYAAKTGAKVNVYAVTSADAEKNGWNMTSSGIGLAINDAANADSPVKLMASIDTYNANAAEWTTPTTPQDTDVYNDVYLDAGINYLIFAIDGENSSAPIDTANGAHLYYYLKSLTLTKQPDVIDKTHNFAFGTSALSAATIEAATEKGEYTASNGLIRCSNSKDGSTSPGMEFIDEYSDFDPSKTSEWAITTLGGGTNNLYAGRMDIYIGKNTYGTSRLDVGSASTPYIDTRVVFKINVKHSATYDISADLLDLGYGTEADVYIVKASETDASPLLGTDSVSGYKRITMDYIKSLPISSAAPELSRGVAETTLGAAIAACKGMFTLPNDTRNGLWRDNFDKITDFYGIKIGVISAGMAGRAFIKLLHGFEVDILVYDPTLSAEEIAELGGEKRELDELLAESDVISIHAPNIPATDNMFNADNLHLVKDGAVIINTARANVIDEPAFIEELRKNRFTAVIDVMNEEPPALDHPYRALPNVVLFPHIAGAATNGCRRMGKFACDDAERLIKGERMLGEVNLRRLSTLA